MTEHQDDPVRPETDPPGRVERAGTDETSRNDAADTFTLADPPGPGTDPLGPGTDLAGAGSDPSGPALQPTAGFHGVAPDYDKYGVPSLDFVRNKIEGRYATSIGAAELAQQTPEATSAAERAGERERLAQEALDRIRQSLRDNKQS